MKFKNTKLGFGGNKINPTKKLRGKTTVGNYETPMGTKTEDQLVCKSYLEYQEERIQPQIDYSNITLNTIVEDKVTATLTNYTEAQLTLDKTEEDLVKYLTDILSKKNNSNDNLLVLLSNVDNILDKIDSIRLKLLRRVDEIK